MPADVRAALGDGVEAAILVQWIQGGLLVCVHRYLAEILEDRLGYAGGGVLGARASAPSRATRRASRSSRTASRCSTWTRRRS